MAVTEAQREERVALVRAYLESDQTVARWSAENGVHRQSMYRWMEKYGDEALATPPDPPSAPAGPSEPEPEPTAAPAFVELAIDAPEPEQAAPAITVQVAGATVTVPAGADPACVRSVLRALAGAAR